MFLALVSEAGYWERGRPARTSTLRAQRVESIITIHHSLFSLYPFPITPYPIPNPSAPLEFAQCEENNLDEKVLATLAIVGHGRAGLRPGAGRGFLIGIRQVLLLPPICLSLFLFLTLFAALLDIIEGRQSVGPRTWILLSVILILYFVTGAFVWRVYIRPLVYRWLVIHGQATVGHITLLIPAKGRAIPTVYYEFETNRGVQIKTKEALWGTVLQEFVEGNTVIDVLYW